MFSQRDGIMIIIAPCSRPLLNGKKNPKDYPYWKELCELLIKEGYDLVQIGREKDIKYVEDFRVLNINELEKLLNECDTYITIDSFFQHLGWYKEKKGIVIFSISDPLIFGHKENINLVLRKNLRPNQFDIYENEQYKEEVFVKPEIVVKEVKRTVKK